MADDAGDFGGGKGMMLEASTDGERRREMTPIERVAQYENELCAAEEISNVIAEKLETARRDLFRERYGFSVGDWILHDRHPAKVVSIEIGLTSDWDRLRIAPFVEKERRFAYNGRDLWGDWPKHVALWPAERPLPEVKP